jgi:hypothetical protein
MRAAQPAGRAVAGWVAGVVTFAAIGLVLTASGSGRTATITPVTTVSPSAPPSASIVASPSPQQTPSPEPDESAPRPAIDAFLSLLLAAVLVLFGYLGWSRIRWGGIGLARRRARTPPGSRRPPDPIGAGPAAGSLTEAVDAGLRQLDEGEPRDAVVACWVLLERAAAEAGTARRPSETPAQLVTRVLAEHRVTGEALDRLVGLYREARYSRHVLGDPARAQARTALERVRRELTGEMSVR